MKILVTGAAGFIGMHVAQALATRGDDVVGCDNLNDYYDPALKQAHARRGDVLVGISTSGASANVIRAAEHARNNGISVIALTGRSSSAVGALADIEICTPGGQFADRVQELHIKVIHILIELVERRLFPENYDS